MKSINSPLYKIRRTFLLFILFLGLYSVPFSTSAQVYPITITTQVIPPFSPYLNDYLSDINKVKLLIHNSQYAIQNIRFAVSLTGEDNGVKIYNVVTYMPPQPYTCLLYTSDAADE